MSGNPYIFNLFRSAFQGQTAGDIGYDSGKLRTEGLSPQALGRLYPDYLHATFFTDHHAHELSERAVNAFRFLPETAELIFDTESAQNCLKMIGKSFTVDPPNYTGWGSHYYSAEVKTRDIKRIIENYHGPIESLQDALASVPLAELETPSDFFVAIMAGSKDKLEAIREKYAETAPLAKLEMDFLAGLTPQQARHAYKAFKFEYEDGDVIAPDILADIPGYIQLFGDIWQTALTRIRQVHSGDIAFKSDKAFTRAEANVLGRAVQVGLARDLPWLSDLTEFWEKTAIAPDAKVKGCPSQRTVYNIANAVTETPSPEAVEAMRQVNRQVRHASVKKRLERKLKAAQRALSQRPDLLTRMNFDEEIPQSLMTTLKRSIEHLYKIHAQFPFPEWEKRFIVPSQMATVARKLIWTIKNQDGSRFEARPKTVRGQTVWLRVGGQTCDVSPDQTIALWHPLEASGESREAWRDHILRTKTSQPFAQAFREYYRIDAQDSKAADTAMFSGFVMDHQRLGGVALSTGWRVGSYDGLVYSVEPYQFTLECGYRYPGDMGSSESGKLSELKRQDNGALKPVNFEAVDPILLSEILRQADLIVSVGTGQFSADAAGLSKYYPGMQTLQMRKEALRRMYNNFAGVEFDANYMKIGDCRIHLATARVTRKGDPVDMNLQEQKGKARWLPYKDMIMGKIVHITHELTEMAN